MSIDYIARWHLGSTDTRDVVVTLPLRIYSPLNGSHGQWVGQAHRRKKQRHNASWACGGPLAEYRKALAENRLPAIEIRITRIAPRELDDDNMIAGAKSIRDGVADALGVDDRDKRLRWLYTQEKGKPKEYATRITVAGRPTSEARCSS